MKALLGFAAVAWLGAYAGGACNSAAPMREGSGGHGGGDRCYLCKPPPINCCEQHDTFCDYEGAQDDCPSTGSIGNGCGALPGQFGPPACGTCLIQSCCAKAAACDTGTPCYNLLACESEGSGGSCASFAAGQQALNALNTCIEDQCPVCTNGGGSSSLGGSGGASAGSGGSAGGSIGAGMGGAGGVSP